MRWECSECGEKLAGASPPSVCGSCGLAVGVFVLTNEEDDEPSWTRFGASHWSGSTRPRRNAEEHERRA